MPEPPSFSLPRLRDLVGFRLHLRRFLSFSEQAAEAAGVTAQHYQLLQIVGLAEDGPPSISMIAERMLLRHNSAVELVDRAERAGLVRRIHDETDHRRAPITITPQGESALALLLEQHLQYLYQSGPGIAASLELVLEGSR